MPAPSHFDRHFSPEEQAKIAAWLDSHPHTSVDDFRSLLSERGLDVARSTAHREKRRLEELGVRLRTSRRLMDSLSEQLEGTDDSKRIRALTELGSTLAFEFQEVMLGRDPEDVDSLDVVRMTRAIKDLTVSVEKNLALAEAERALRAAREAIVRKLDEAERDAAATGAGRDASAVDMVKRIRQEIYGIFDD